MEGKQEKKEKREREQVGEKLEDSSYNQSLQN